MKKILAVLVSAISIASFGLSAITWGQVHVQTQTQNLQFPRNMIVRLDMFDTFGSSEVQIGICAGVIIKDGLVLSAAHCFPDNAKVRVDGKEAKIVKRDESRDLLLIKVEGVSCSPKCPPVAIKNAPVDTKIVTIGHPVGFPSVATEGRVEGIQDTGSKAFTLITSPIIFGNSGGGVFTLVNSQWVLVGIVSQIRTLGDFFPAPIYHLGIAVNAETITDFLNGTGY